MFFAPFVFLALMVWPVAVCGFFISSRRMGFFVDAVSHSAMAVFTFVICGLVLWEGVDVMWGTTAAVLAVGLAGALMSFRLFGSQQGERGEPWMGEVFVGSLATAAIVMSQFPLRGIDFDALFVGQALLLESWDVYIAGVFGLVFVVGFRLWGNAWMVFFTDQWLYRHFYGRKRWPLFVLFFLMSSVVAFLVQSVGVIFAFSVLMFPGRIAQRLAKAMPEVWTLTVLIILGIACLGMAVSYWVNLPVGPVCGLLWLLAEGVSVGIRRLKFWGQGG